MAKANTVLTAGQVLWISPETWDENVTMVNGVVYGGYGLAYTFLTGTWTCPAGYTCEVDYAAFQNPPVLGNGVSMSSQEAKISYTSLFGPSSGPSQPFFRCTHCLVVGPLAVSDVWVVFYGSIHLGVLTITSTRFSPLNVHLEEVYLSGGTSFGGLTVNSAGGTVQFDAITVMGAGVLTLNGTGISIATGAGVPVDAFSSTVLQNGAALLPYAHYVGSLNFNPATPSDWKVVPSTAGTALNQLAAQSVSSATCSGGGVSCSITGNQLSVSGPSLFPFQAVHFTSTATPTAVVGTGAGAGATLVLIGNDFGFTLQVTTGTSPVAGGVVAQVTFGAAYASTPRSIVMSSINNAARNADLANTGAYTFYSDWSTAGFSLVNCCNGPLGSGTYQWSFVIVA